MNKIKLLTSVFILMLVMVIYLPVTHAQDNGKQKAKREKQTEVIPEKTRAPEIVQAPFYDAIELYYCLNGYKTYPTVTNASGVVAGSTTGEGADVFGHTRAGETVSAGPALSLSTVNRLIECGTGKIVQENVAGKRLDSTLKSLRFKAGEEDLQQEIIRSILVRYTSLPQDTSWQVVQDAYKDNVYIYDLITSKEKFASAQLSAFKDEVSRVGGGLPKISTLAEGLADFYIERVNEEINDAFFIHLKNELQKFPELAILFPKTLESMDKIEVTRYNNSINALKSAYTDDVKSILSNISGLAVLKKYQELINRFTPLTILFTAADVIDKINKDTPPAELLHQLNYADYISGKYVNANSYNAVVRMACLLSYCGRDIKRSDENKTKKGWLGEEKFKYLAGNAGVFQLFTGLMAQKANGILFNIPGQVTFNFQQALYSHKVEVLQGHYLTFNFLQTVDKIDGVLAQLERLQKDQAKRSDIAAKYLIIVQELLGFSENCLLVLPTNSQVIKLQKTINRIQDEFIPWAEQCCSVVSKVEEKDYSAAIFEADTLASFVFKDLKANLRDQLSTANDEEKKLIEEKIEETERIENGFLHYGLFISSVAASKTSEDVKNAISAFALPRGSSRIKKEHLFSWGINGYAGVSHSWNESYKDYHLPRQETNVYAPLGIGVNWGSILGNSSLSLYGGIIDIGAIFTYRIANDSTHISSDIEFGQILSPSVSFIYGFPLIKKYNIPISFGASYQWGPKLKKVNEEGNSVLPLLARRFHVFAGVDIPIVNFYVSKKK